MARSNATTKNCFSAATGISDADVRKLDAAADRYGTGDIAADYSSAVADMIATLQGQRDAIKTAMDGTKSPAPALPQADVQVPVNQDAIGPGAAEAAAVNRDVTGPGIPNVAINSDVADSEPLTRFRSLFGKAKPGVKPTLASVQKLVDGLRSVLKSGLDIVVSENPVKAGVAASIPTGMNPPGAVIDGRLYLFSDNIVSDFDAKVTLFHELFHIGLQKVLAPQDFAALLKQFAADPQVAKYMREWRGTTDAKDRAEKLNSAAVEAIAVEEALARIGEDLTANEGAGTRFSVLARPFMKLAADVATKFRMHDLAARVRAFSQNGAERFVVDMVNAAMGGPVSLAGKQQNYTAQAQQNGVSPRFRTPAKPQAKSTPFNDTASTFLEVIKSKGANGIVKFMLTRDLVGMAAKVIPSASKYLAAMDAITVQKTKAERSVADIVESFAKLPKHEQGKGDASVNRVLKDATMAKAWPFVPAWLPKDSVKVDPEATLTKRFNGLSADGQALVKRVFQHGHESLQAMQAAVVDNTNSEYDALIKELTAAGKLDEAKVETDKKAKSLRDFESLLKIRSGWPYAPLRRFGKHVVMAMSARYMQAKAEGNVKLMQELEKDGDHYYVAFAESKREAIRMENELRSNYPDGDVGTFEKLEQADEMMGGRDILGAMRRLRRLTAESVEGADLGVKTAGRVDDMMRQLYLTLLSETSARKGEIHRKNIAGADADMMRAFSTQGVATAHFIASLKTNGKVEDHLADMRTEVGSKLSGRDEKQRYYNEIMRRHSMNLEFNPTPGIDKALATSSVYLLLSNPSYFLMNATQPWMMSHPMMAGRHGYGKAAAALLQGSKDTLAMVKTGVFDETSYQHLPQDVRAAIEALADKGVLQIELGQELGDFKSDSDGNLKYVEKGIVALRSAAQSVETFNRVSTAIAAYRMEKQRTGSHEAAIDYAAQIIDETHGNYTGFNAPRFMRTGIGRLTTQFRKFQLIQLSMFARMVSRAVANDPKLNKDENRQVQMAARYALIYNLGHLTAIGGVAALPGFTAAAWLVGKIWPGDDEPDDPRATMTRWWGKETADLLWGGASQAAGVPVGGRIGAGNMLSILPYTDIQVSREGYAGLLMGLTGPLIGGLMPRAYDGIGMVASGDVWKGLEALSPALVANTSKAIRFETQGVTQRNGDQALSPDEISILDSALQAVGLPTNTIQERTYLAGAKFKADTFYKDRTSSLKKAYSEAFRDNDADAMREVRDEWLSTQTTRRELGFSVQPLSELLKAPQEQRKREAGMIGGVGSNKSTDGFLRTFQ